jgi:hypothetical protein
MAENSTCFSPTLMIDERRVSARESVTSTSRRLLRYAAFLEGNMRMPYDGDEEGQKTRSITRRGPIRFRVIPRVLGAVFLTPM